MAAAGVAGRHVDVVAWQAGAHQTVELMDVTIAGRMEVTTQTALDVAHVCELTSDTRIIEPGVGCTIRRTRNTERSAHLATVSDVLDHWARIGRRLLSATSRPASTQSNTCHLTGGGSFDPTLVVDGSDRAEAPIEAHRSHGIEERTWASYRSVAAAIWLAFAWSQSDRAEYKACMIIRNRHVL
jgi:hypothetical protein